MALTIAKKKNCSDGIYFTGPAAADEVTGSQYLIKFGDKQILLECGLHQSNDYLESYNSNSEKFKFNPREIDYVFLNHAHIDHSGLLPRLVKEGFHGQIITTYATAKVTEALLHNSSYILADEARVLSKRYSRDYMPIYTDDEVYETVDYFYIYDSYNVIYKLDENVSFKWIPNSHCIGSAQLLLILSDENRCKKILYTSDMGSLKQKNHYLGSTEIPDDFTDITIMESTYGAKGRINKKTREFDVEHLRVAIDTVLDRQGTVILPCFSFHRTQEILTTLFEIFGSDPSFNAKIIVDSMLSCQICDIYDTILKNENKALWSRVKSWKNVEFISEKVDSQACIQDDTPKIVLSSSGFCQNGRVVKYLSKYLADENSMIIFSGFIGDDPSYLSYRIKNYKEYKTLNIAGEPIVNRADCITLSTFSSHASHSDLIKFGSSLNTNKIVLVHGSQEAKQNLREELTEAISKNNHTYKVYCSTKDMVCRL